MKNVYSSKYRVNSFSRFLALLLFFALHSSFFTQIALADDVSLEQALQIASKFAASPSTRNLSKRKVPVPKATPTLAYAQRSQVATSNDNVYVINLGSDQGFVVISGETGTEDEVLGYCDHGSFDYNNCPVQLKDLLTQYSNEVDSLRQNRALAVPRRVSSYPSYIGNIVVGPLLTTTWNQWGPYNILCPQGCPSGCVPTAVAQIMNYWKWPKQSIGVLDNGEDFSGHVYDWDNMLDSYNGYYNEAQAQAVAQLMADVGKAMGTIYAPEGSSTSPGDYALVRNFGYEPGNHVYSSATASQLLAEMKAELNQNRPILYSGRDYTTSDDGHALVCDGYTSYDYFHFNYGWGGSYDGFYKNAAIKLYARNAWILVGLRPYDAIHEIIDGIEYGLMKNGTAEILDYTPGETGRENGALVIPAEITYQGTTYPVTRIRQYSFSYKGHFTELTIGDNIEGIDFFSFFGTKIDKLVLSDKMTTVPAESFVNADVKSLTIGSNIRRIGNKAFYMCKLEQVTSRSPAFEVGDEAFALTRPDCGDWLGCITSLGTSAFLNAYFAQNPYFANLETIGENVFLGARFADNYWFKIPPKVKSIAPTAFTGALTPYGYLERFEVDEANPYFSGFAYTIYNKNQTSLVLLAPANQPGGLMEFPESMVKMEYGSIVSRPASFGNYYYDVLIPATVIDMEGAFANCETMGDLTCLAVTPPVITDATFNDNIFVNSPDITLHVPEGTEMLYADAPGWRRFENIVGDQDYNPLPAQNQQYYMVVNSTDDEQQRISMPISEITSMSLSDDGQNIIIQRNGNEAITTEVAALDSITWIPGFVFENAEIFELNDSTLTVDAQKCSVRFDATVIDDDVQLCVRNSVLKPNVLEGVVRGFGVDLSLSNGQHELTGTADISFPVSVGSDEKLCAAYYNTKTGEWEPVCFNYDQQSGLVTITTNHLSYFSIFYVTNELSNNAILDFYEQVPELYNFNEATKLLLDVVSSDDPDAKMAREFKNDMGLWQSIGLDGLWNIVRGVGEATVDFRPEAIDNAVTAMGYLGTALSILDVIGADIQGDDIGVASGTLKTILNYSTGQIAAAIGTPIMTASMGLVAFIGIALEKFGTTVAERKHDLFNEAYRYFYTKEFGGPCYRTAKDWYQYFYPAFAEGKMSASKLNAFIEQAVRMHCSQFWEAKYNAQYDLCMGEKDVQMVGGHYPYPSEALQQQISDEYFAELMNGTLVSVITAIKYNLKVEADKRFRKALLGIGEVVNTKLIIRFIDSSYQKGETSKYANWWVRLSDSEYLDNAKQFKRYITERGSASMSLTIYSLLQNGLQSNITLSDPDGKDQKSFAFQIPQGKGKVFVTIDIDKGGVDIDTQPLENLELAYMPQGLEWDVYLGDTGYEQDYHHESHAVVALDGSLNKRARFQREIERFFNRHDFITVDQLGNVKIGDNLTAKFENDALEAKGKFTINVSNDYVEQTIDQFIQRFNSKATSLAERLSTGFLLKGNIQHLIEGEFTVTRASVDSQEYTVTYTGKGQYAILANIIKKVTGVDADNLVIQGSEQYITFDNVINDQISQDGEVTLKYTTKLK